MKNKDKKKKQKKLISLIFVLLLTVIMLSTSTYAWFTSNRTVTIDSINVHVETSGGLQISTDGAKWKTVITNEDITDNAYTGNTNQLPDTLSPVSSAMVMDSTGHLEMYSASTGTADGSFTLTTTKETDTAGDTGNYVVFDVFLKNESTGSTDDGKIYLTTASDVLSKTGSEDKGLKQSARVAFVKEGTNTNLNASASSYTSLAPTTGTSDGTNITLWEPNYNLHTDSGAYSGWYYFHSGSETTPVATDGSASRLVYEGVKEAFSAIPLRYSEQTTTDRGHFTSIDTDTLTGLKMINTPADNANKGSYQLALQGLGVTKVRIYMWIEGQDIDCENNASGTDITYNVVLSKNSSASAS